MRKLQYLLCTKVNVGSKAAPIWEDRLAGVEMVYEIVEKEEAEQKIQ